ncbi:MAG: hypothetical protein HY896_06240 [Deltaproteobacteria bacterium]|nr:hypothetical protein [Deltaproteobacteria bacterium]
MEIRDIIESGDVEGEDMYGALGRTRSGRYVTVFFILKQGDKALVVSARDMSANERRRYEKR